MAQIERQFIDVQVGDGRAQAWVTINDAQMRVTSVRYQNDSTPAGGQTLTYRVWKPDTLDIDADPPTFAIDVPPGTPSTSSNVPAGFDVRVGRDGVTLVPSGWKATVSTA